MVMTEYTPPIIPTRFWLKLSALYFLSWVFFSLAIFLIWLSIQNNSFNNRIEEFEKKTYNQLVESNNEKDVLYRENITKIRELQNWFDAINAKLQIVSNKTPIVTDAKWIIVTSYMAWEPKDITMAINVSKHYEKTKKQYPKRAGDWSPENQIRTMSAETNWLALDSNSSIYSTGADRGRCQLNYNTHKNFFADLEKKPEREKKEFYDNYCNAVRDDAFKKKVMPRRGHYTRDHQKTTKQIRIAEEKRNLFKFSSIENKSLDIVSDFNNNT